VQALWWIVTLACGTPGTATPPLPVPEPTITVSDPWTVERREGDAIWFRAGDSGDGVRVALGSGGRGRVPGVTLIVGGRTLEVVEDGAAWPLVAVPWPDRPLSSVEIEVDGVDLFVRIAGPPLSDVSDHAAAPKDPALTWVRVRRRDDDWRIAVTGLATYSLPGDATAIPSPDGTTQITSAWGTLELETASPAHAGAVDADRWWWTTRPSVELAAPYDRTAFTFTPSRAR
jgi:hypothetical protein